MSAERAPAPAPTRARDRSATEERILAAVGEVLAAEGFGGIGVNAIAKHAGVDKVLIYRYFGGLPELLRTWGASGRFWPRVQDLLGDDPAAFLALPVAERYARFFEHFVAELRQRPVTLAILVAELRERNELTVILEAEREQWGEEAARVLGGAEWAERPMLRGLAVLLVAGVQHLLLRARRLRVFGGFDLGSDADWAALIASVREMAELVFSAPPRSAAPPSRLRTPKRQPPRSQHDGRT